MDKNLTDREKLELQEDAIKHGIITKNLWETQANNYSIDTNLFTDLQHVSGCGPATAKKIISKMENGGHLTQKEKDIYDSVR
jgi:Holliday junction resolvasome RuvABC DNA-binding subunit